MWLQPVNSSEAITIIVRIALPEKSPVEAGLIVREYG
jgi:hypothetical protein